MKILLKRRTDDWQKTVSSRVKKLTHTEVVDPICLAAKITEPTETCCCCGEIDVNSIPESICRVFDDVIVDNSNVRKVYVTLGLFTIVRLERDVQLLIPVIDYCIPQKECVTSTDSDPCDFFERLRFPVDEFFPPEKKHFDSLEPDRRDCCCNND